MTIVRPTPDDTLDDVARPQVGVRHALVPSPLGELTVCAEGDALTGVYFEGHRHPPTPRRLGARVAVGDDPVLAAAQAQLVDYFGGERTVFELALAPVGEPFQLRVWRRLRAIPYGERTTYGAIAREFGDPHLARAVGAAVGRNPLSIVVPCHRVVGSTGSLTGFAGGLDRKARLLDLEAADSLLAL